MSCGGRPVVNLWGDPDSGVGFGYFTNLWNYRPDDPRATNLAKAVRACLG
ncbi:hypothetical protein [Amycolatopsis sp. NPDC098790]